MNHQNKQPLICLILAASFVLSSFSSAAAEPRAQKTRDELLTLHNQERSKEELNPLKVSPELTKVAQQYADYLAASGEFSHTAKGTPKSRRKQAGYDSRVGGENIAKGQPTVTEVFKEWMGSKVRKENILRDDFSDVGFGFAQDKDGEVVWVVDFGSR